MKALILLIFFLGITFFSFGQNLKTNDLTSLAKFDLGTQGIGFSFEPRLTKKMTIDLSLGAGGGYDVSEEGVAYQWNIFKPAFYFSITPKFYYNRQKRIESEKLHKLNSGDYFGLQIKYVTATTASNDRFRSTGLINLHYGVQRAIGNRWAINAHVGGGYAQDLEYKFGTIYPSLDFKLSYIL